MENHIRGLVFSMYPSIASFANSIGWKRNKASRIVNGVQRPSAEDMEAMSKCLKISDPEIFVSIFFADMFTK